MVTSWPPPLGTSPCGCLVATRVWVVDSQGHLSLSGPNNGVHTSVGWFLLLKRSSYLGFNILKSFWRFFRCTFEPNSSNYSNLENLCTQICIKSRLEFSWGVNLVVGFWPGKAYEMFTTPILSLGNGWLRIALLMLQRQHCLHFTLSKFQGCEKTTFEIVDQEHA
jgi:hypothetical protein